MVVTASLQSAVQMAHAIKRPLLTTMYGLPVLLNRRAHRAAWRMMRREEGVDGAA